MSFPPNPLADYRSVSYYHVLAVCDSTETADHISTLLEEDVWKHPTNDALTVDEYATYGKFAPKKVRLPNGTSEGLYSILIDGSADADFSITSARWAAATAADATPGDKGTSIAIEGSITVSEPKGVVFADTIVGICQSINVTLAQAVFVLKTFFVGHMHDGSTNQDTPANIVNLAPYEFIVADMQGVFTENGGEYTLVTVGIQHGAARLPQYSRAASSFNIHTGGGTLRETIKNLEIRVQRNYASMYTCVKSTVDSGSSGSGDMSAISSRLTNVLYTIELDPAYDDTYTVSVAPQCADTPACDAGGSLTFPADMSIEEAIHQIMGRCKKVQEELGQSNKNAPAGTAKQWGYKVHASLISRRVQGSAGSGSGMEFVIAYKIQRFMEPRSINFFEAAQENISNPALDNNTITFDYIYTGQNVDILDFDIKMSLGLQYLQVATSSNSTRNHLSQAPTRVTALQRNATVPVGNAPIPVCFGSSITTPMFRNMATPSSGIQAAYTLAKHSSFESLEVSMRIYGNPLLMNAINRASSPSSTTGTSNTLVDFTRHPAFAKVNIKMPRTNDDIALFQGLTSSDTDSADFTKDFWFQGYYYIYGIETSFDRGDFTQTLHMIGLPPKGTLDSMKGAREIEFDFENRVEKCYDQLLSGSSPEKMPPTVPHTPPARDKNSANVSPSNTRDTLDTLKESQAQGVVGVKGFDTADPAVQQSIIMAGATSPHPGVNATTLARIAAAENKLHASGKNPYSSATGAFQFTSDTWMRMVKKGMVPGISPNEPPETALQKRNDPKYASAAAASSLSDEATRLEKNGFEVNDVNLYVMHHFGAGDGIKILKGAREKDTTLSRFSDKRVARIKKDNPYLAPAQTPQDVVDLVAGRLAGVTKKGIVVTSTTASPPPKQDTSATSGQSLVKAHRPPTKPVINTKPCRDDTVEGGPPKG